MWFGKPNISRLERNWKVKILNKALSYPKDSKVRRLAVIKLGSLIHSLSEIKAVDALPIILGMMLRNDVPTYKTLDELDKLIRVSTANSLYAALGLDGLGEYDRKRITIELAERHDIRAWQPLLDLLDDEYVPMRWAAIEGIGKLGDPRAIDVLTRLLCLVDRARSESLKTLRSSFVWTPRTPKEAAWEVITDAEEEYSHFFTFWGSFDIFFISLEINHFPFTP